MIIMKNFHCGAFFLLVIGGLNWLLVGLFQWDLGEIFGGQEAMISRLIYILVGLAALYEVATHKSSCRACTADKIQPAPMEGQDQ